YQAVSGPLLAAIKDRPLAVIHWNQGVGKPGWFEQNTGQKAEPWMKVLDTPSSKGPVRHLVADRPETLRWLAQHAALELHMWHSRAQSLTMPDWVVFDLDPADGKGIEQAIEVAQILRGMFERLVLPSVLKTTGLRGVDGVSVSTPLRWNEVEAGLDPKRFNLRTVPDRLKEVGDLFAPALRQGVRLPRFKR